MANPKGSGQDDYYPFERVLKELQIEEDELRRLVSEGEIRAFRDEDKMKFRKSDIDGLKKGRMTEPTIILPQNEHDDSAEESEVLLVEDEGDSTSETLLDIGDVPDGEGSSGASVPTVDLASSSEDFEEEETGTSSHSGPGDTNTEELTFEQDSNAYVTSSTEDVLLDSSEELTAVSTPSKPTKSSGKSTKAPAKPVAPISDFSTSESGENDGFIDSDTGFQTEPLGTNVDSPDFNFAPDEQTESEPEKEETSTKFPEEEPAIGEEEQGNFISQEPAQVQTVFAQEESISSGMLFLMIAASIILLFSGMLVINAIQDVDTPSTGWFTDIIYSQAPAKHLYVNGNIADKQIEAQLEKRKQWRSE